MMGSRFFSSHTPDDAERSAKVLIVIGGLLFILTLALVVFEVGQMRKQEERETNRQLSVLSSTAAAHFSTYSKSASVLAGSIHALVVRKDRLMVSDADASKIRSLLAGSPLIGVLILDEKSDLVAQVSQSPTTADLREIMRVARKHQGEERWVDSVDYDHARTPDEESIFFSSPLKNEREKRLGSVIVLIDPSLLASFSNKASSSPKFSLDVFNIATKQSLAHLPGPRFNLAADGVTATTVAEAWTQSDAGSAEALSTILTGSQATVMASMTLVPDSQMLAVATIPSSVVRDAWYGFALRIGTIGGAVLLISVFLLAVIYRQLNHLAKHSVAIAREETQFDAVIQHVSDAVFVRTTDGAIVVANEAFATMFGLKSATEVVGMSISRFGALNLAHFSDSAKIAAMLASGEPISDELTLTLPSGKLIDLEYLFSPIVIGENRYLLGQLRDISERKRYENSLMRQATYDETTNLPNRRLFNDRLSHVIASCKRTGAKCAVLFLDLDNFKHVNDMVGLALGDQILAQVAKRLVSISRATDTVARFGGDEFVILLPEFSAEAEVERFADRLVHIVSELYTVDNHRLSVTASVGIAVYPIDAADPSGLLQHADTAMYEAKHAGGNLVRFFNEKMHKAVNDLLLIDTNLRTALRDNNITMVYQPVVNAETNDVIWAEAFPRWALLEVGEVAPDVLVRVAEENGSMREIGAWMLRQACLDAVEWNKRESMPIGVALNITPGWFFHDAFVPALEEALLTSGIPRHLLGLEIDEAILSVDDPRTEEIVKRIVALGVMLCLDNFGTHCTSLIHVAKFPFMALKMSPSFVFDVETDIRTLELTKAVVAMAKTLNVSLVADGVERDTQANVLRSVGCTLVQGRYFGLPGPVKMITNQMGTA